MSIITNYTQEYMDGIAEVAGKISKKDINDTITALVALKKRKGRLFLIGVGGSAANCSHAVNDFRKICNIETYTPVDNVSELTARTNDDGWDSVFVNWLIGSHLSKKDAIMVFSVGGGNLETNISTNIPKALKYAKKKGTTILGIVSRDGGYTKKVATHCVLIPIITDDKITAFAEAYQAVVWHGIANCPALVG
ncbi:MAG: SIS domain-containing protein [Candidatus Paceibacterota bacterium]